MQSFLGPRQALNRAPLPAQAAPFLADDTFQHIIRVLNTNVDGKNKIMYALTAIRGVGRRFAALVCKKAEIDMNKRCALYPRCGIAGGRAAPGAGDARQGPGGARCSRTDEQAVERDAARAMLPNGAPPACRAGELTPAELESLMVIVSNPRTFKIPDWFLNRKKDHKDGRYGQVVSNQLDMKLRDDLERLKKIR